MKKKQILVCGTGFGKIYLKAIAESKEYELMGILGKGSDRSRLLSKNLNVPMYTDIKEINQNVDAACVVVPNAAGGGNGANIAKSILAKGMANMICDKEIIALEPSAYMRTAFMARLMEHNEVKERISLLPIDVGKYSFRDKISGVMCMGVLGHLKRDEQEKLLYKLDKNLNINVPILIELLEPKFLVAPVGSRISVATQGRLRYETYITDIKQVGMDQWTWRLTYKVFCGKNIVSTVDSLMSWNYQSVEKILNQLTKMHFRTAKLSETLLLAIKAR